MTLRELGEFGLIRHLTTRLSTRSGVQMSIGDDAALLDALRAPLVTCDALIEDVHFRRDWSSPRQLGRKALSVNVSDIAAMGGVPVAAFLALALPPDTDLRWLEELYSGMEEIAAEFDFTIAGGDTTRSSGPVFLAVTLVGDAPQNFSVWRRGGAQVGDAVLVTGTLGDSAAGLALLQKSGELPADSKYLKRFEYSIGRHLNPTPRLREALAAQKCALQFPMSPIHAALDLSDGIAGDAAHIGRAAGVCLEIQTELLPISTQAREAASFLGADAIDWALRGGEDYELLWCAAPDVADEFCEAVARETSTRITRVGRVVEMQNAPVKIIGPDGISIGAGAFEHF